MPGEIAVSAALAASGRGFKKGKEMEHKFKTTDIKGKAYVMVNERIKYFWQTYPAPNGQIVTQMTKNEDGVCLFVANIYVEGALVATGHAQEKETGSFINKTSYIENCETSAVGRALGMLGIGIDTSIATAEEVETAIANQDGGKPEITEPEKTEVERIRADVLKTVQLRFKTKKAFDDWREKNHIKSAIKDMTESELSMFLDILESSNED